MMPRHAQKWIKLDLSNTSAPQHLQEIVKHFYDVWNKLTDNNNFIYKDLLIDNFYDP